jgi:ADP-heptose:LPS heptosyltransferase
MGMHEFNFETVHHIAIVRALPGLGDFLCVVPALRSLRAAFPQAQVTLIGLPSTKALVGRFWAYMDEFVALPGYPGLPEQTPNLEQLQDFLIEMRSRQFDLALQLHGSGVISNQLTQAIGAKCIAGFYLPGHDCPDPITFLPFQESESEIRRSLRLLTHLQMASQSEALEFPIQPDEERDFQTLKQIYSIQSYVCLHAGASVSTRRWSGLQFAAVGDAVAEQGYQVVLTGAVEERGLADAIAQAMQHPCLNLAGRTSLGTLAALLRDARLLVCNDTGVSHLGAAVRVPSVVIFSQSDPRRWAPLEQNRHRAIWDAQGVSLSAVLEQVNALLKQEPIYA